ncbi:MAG: hypothetical protein AABO41_13115 [Acidobacteriota bacterium]
MTRKKGKTSVTPRTTAEWVSMIISIVLLAGVVGVVIVLWLSPSNEPARFRIDRKAIRNEASKYYLPITVTNEGDATGAQVTVEGRLGGSADEQISATIFDFIPAHSSVEGVLIFDTEPTSAELRVVSYQQP